MGELNEVKERQPESNGNGLELGRPPVRRRQRLSSDSSAETLDSSNEEEAKKAKSPERNSKHSERVSSKPAHEDAPARDSDEQRPGVSLHRSTGRSTRDENVESQTGQKVTEDAGPATDLQGTNGEVQPDRKPTSAIDRGAFHRLAVGHLLGSKREPRKKAA